MRELQHGLYNNKYKHQSTSRDVGSWSHTVGENAGTETGNAQVDEWPCVEDYVCTRVAGG